MTSSTEKIFDRLQKQLRTKAEAQLADEGEDKDSSMSVDKILHELHVHQIELEMQNEELRNTQIELEKARDRYIDLYDFAPAGHLSIDANGMIEECNLSAADLLGLKRTELIRRPFAEFIAEKDRDEWYLHCKHHNNPRTKQTQEWVIRRSDGIEVPVLLDSLCVQGKGSSLNWRIALTDITQRKQAEQALRIAAVAFETQEGILVTDANMTVLCANSACSRITGFTGAEMVGKAPSFLANRLNDKNFHESFWTAVADDGYWQGEIWDQRKNGERLALLLNFSKVPGEDGEVTHYVGCFTDITQKKLAEKILMNHYQHLQHQVHTTQTELEQSRLNAADVTTALNVLLKQRNNDLAETRDALSFEAERTVLPFLSMLKKGTRDRNELRLIDILETNLKHLLESYGSSGSLTSAYQKLTPVEIQVAALVRQGLPTKVIADSLNLASGTVSIHRKHIRKKLGLDKKSLNLYSYLVSLAEKNSH